MYVCVFGVLQVRPFLFADDDKPGSQPSSANKIKRKSQPPAASYAKPTSASSIKFFTPPTSTKDTTTTRSILKDTTTPATTTPTNDDSGNGGLANEVDELSVYLESKNIRSFSPFFGSETQELDSLGDIETKRFDDQSTRPIEKKLA